MNAQEILDRLNHIKPNSGSFVSGAVKLIQDMEAQSRNGIDWTHTRIALKTGEIIVWDGEQELWYEKV